MAKYDINLRPIHYASVSGGKDSLYMLGLILANPDKYPLDCVVHYELEIDWGWVKNVVDEMERRCKKVGIPFYRIKPEHDWMYFYEKWGYPSRVSRWCNSDYKLSCEKQLRNWVKSQKCRPIAYIGFCADETKRFKYEVGGGNWELGDLCYPLAEEGIEEDFIWEWAKKQPIFGNWYQYFRRQGCMGCPMATNKEWAYMLKYYPDDYERLIGLVKKSDSRINKNNGRNYVALKIPAEQFDKNIRTKWASILEMEENQQTIFDLMEQEENNEY